MNEPKEDILNALRIFTYYHDGLISESELVSRLAELPRDVLELLPSHPPSYPPSNGPSFKERVLDLKGAMERGETFYVMGGC